MNAAKRVCTSCLPEPGVLEFIEESADLGSCTYCEGERAALLSEVASYMRQQLRLEYSLAVEELGWNGEEGGYSGVTSDTWDLLYDDLQVEADDDKLRGDLVNAIGMDAWCDRDPACLSESQRLTWSWSACCERLKFGRRYFFSRETPAELNPDEFEPDHLMTAEEVLALVCRHAEAAGLFRFVEQGSAVYRARELGASPLITALDFGPPPAAFAPTNRMSPAGIPMFYAAESEVTARAEIAPAMNVAVAEFRLERPALVLDLTDAPHVPGLFEGEAARLRPGLIFLRQFIRDASIPIERNERREHVEYVPTQVVAEYLRFVFKHAGRSVDGIRFPSSRVPSGKCVALFATRHDLVLTNSERDSLTGEPVLQRRSPLLRFVRRLP